jgi:hypothetical protein
MAAAFEAGLRPKRLVRDPNWSKARGVDEAHVAEVQNDG